jgi:hypothetical protein
MLNMMKHKKNPMTQDKTTTIFGYTLFTLTVLSFLITTAIPFSFSLQYPTARHFNIIVMVVVFGVSAILPALVSYFFGDKATHAKNKSLHHYNGVLFGIAAYWVAQLFSWVGFSSIMGMNNIPYPTPMVIANIIPVILTIVVMAILAMNYGKKRKKTTSVLHYLPFQLVLIVSVLIGFVYPYGSGDFAADFLAVIGTFAIPLVVTALAYRVLAKYNPTRLARLSDAIVAMSMGWISMWLAASFLSFSRLPYQTEGILVYVIGFIVFVAYLYLRTRKSRK